MKKRSIKNFELKKKTISNLNDRKGGQEQSVTITLVCWSIISCPTVGCTNDCSSVQCLIEEMSRNISHCPL